MKQKYWIRESAGTRRRGINIYAASDRAAREEAVTAMAVYQGPWQLETQDSELAEVRIVVKHLGKITTEDDEKPLNLPF